MIINLLQSNKNFLMTHYDIYFIVIFFVNKIFVSTSTIFKILIYNKRHNSASQQQRDSKCKHSKVATLVCACQVQMHPTTLITEFNNIGKTHTSTYNYKCHVSRHNNKMKFDVKNNMIGI